ncbi:MAG: glycosyltransferase [Roseovarius sp.]|nr:glycosyltransferase [Roseovarius sp.]
MRAELSVIIPTLEAGEALPACLGALFEGLRAGLIREVIVSDGGSGDATRAIAEEAGAMVVTGPPSRGGQLRRGASAAQGAWFLFLHADTVLPEGWAGAVRARMARGGPAAFRLGFDAEGRAPRLWRARPPRRRRSGLPYGDQAILVSRRAYEAAAACPISR